MIELERQQMIQDIKQKDFENRMEYIKLKHKQIIKEIEALAKAGIKHFER